MDCARPHIANNNIAGIQACMKKHMPQSLAQTHQPEWFDTYMECAQPCGSDIDCIKSCQKEHIPGQGLVVPQEPSAPSQKV
jgi:hypothetical protein